MTTKVRPAKEPAVKTKTCEVCGGHMVRIPEPASIADGAEVRCLMCGRVSLDTTKRYIADMYPDSSEPDPKIHVTRPAVRFLKSLLEREGVEPGKAFRLEKTEQGATVSIARGRYRDVNLPPRGKTVLFISRRAAIELDGSKIGLDGKGPEKRLSIISGGPQAASRPAGAPQQPEGTAA